MSGLDDNTAKTGLPYNKLSPDSKRFSAQTKKLAGRGDIEMGVAFIEQSFDVQLERLQLLVDGATLAAEQVQDKRLEVLESGKEVGIKDVLFDLAVMYFWEVGVIGYILKPAIQDITKSICTGLLRTRTVYNYLPKTDYGYQIIGMARGEKDSAKIIHEIIGEHVGSKNFSSKDYAMFSQEVVDFISNNKSSDKAMRTGSKKAIEMYKKLKSSHALGSADTPGVAMLKAAQSYSGRHRMFLLMQRARIKSLLRTQESLTKEELHNFLSIFEWGQLPDPDFIRDQYKLVFEILIWAQLYGFKKYSPHSPDALLNGSIMGVNDKIVRYWYDRFKPLLDQYERMGRGPFDQLPPFNKSSKLKAYFEDTIEGYQNLSQVTGSIDTLFSVKNKVYEDF